MNFLHFALFLFVVCAAVLVLVSLVTPAPDPAHIAALTVATRDEPLAQPPEAMTIPGGHEHLPDTRSDVAWRRRDLGWSLLLVGLVGLIWLWFS